MKRLSTIMLTFLSLSILLFGQSAQVYGQSDFEVYGLPGRQGPKLKNYFKKNNIQIAELLTIGGIIDMGNPEEDDKISPSNIRGYLKKNFPDENSTGRVVLNWETRAFKDLRDYPKSDRRYKDAEGEWKAMIKIIRQERPHLKIGIYGIPFRVWGSWQRMNYNPQGKFDDLLSLVDFLSPGVYIQFPDEEVGHERNLKYIQDNLDIALAYGKSLGKPVYPFVWHRVHFANRTYGHELIQKEVLAKYVKHISTYSFNNYKSKGVFMWEEGEMSTRLRDLNGLRGHLKGKVKDWETYDQQMVSYAAAILKELGKSSDQEGKDLTSDSSSEEEEEEEVSNFTLINAETGSAIQMLRNGSTLNLAALPTTKLSIRANANFDEKGSVVFNLTGAQNLSRTENSVPYALFGGNNDEYNAWTPAVGSYTLKATPYSRAHGEGKVGQGLSIDFNVIDTNTDADGQVVSFTLINSNTNLPIGSIHDGDIINLADLPTNNVNIRANTNSKKIRSVEFNLSGQLNRNKIEKGAPYALFSDKKGNYHAWNPEEGTYTLKATPFLGNGDDKIAGGSKTITFTVVEDSDSEIYEANNAGGSSSELVHAYPNPVTSTLYIKAGEVGEGVTIIKLFDLAGDVVRTQEINVTGSELNAEVDVKNLQPGRYVLTVNSPKGLLTRQHIVVN